MPLIVVVVVPTTDTVAPASGVEGPSNEALDTVPLTVAVPLPPLPESPQPTKLKIKPMLKNNPT
jgi:hypothetical protein